MPFVSFDVGALALLHHEPGRWRPLADRGAAARAFWVIQFLRLSYQYLSTGNYVRRDALFISGHRDNDLPRPFRKHVRTGRIGMRFKELADEEDQLALQLLTSASLWSTATDSIRDQARKGDEAAGKRKRAKRHKHSSRRPVLSKRKTSAPEAPPAKSPVPK